MNECACFLTSYMAVQRMYERFAIYLTKTLFYAFYYIIPIIQARSLSPLYRRGREKINAFVKYTLVNGKARIGAEYRYLTLVP